MATVPGYGGNQAAPSSAPAGGFSAPSEINAAPQQLQQMGQALERGGQVAGNIAVDMQQQVNQVRVDDALNKAREKVLSLTYDQTAGYKNLKGDAALTRPDGKMLDDEYGAKLTETISELSGKLGNDAQRLAFTQHANGLSQQFRAGVMQHANDEYKQYALSTQDGTIKLGADQAARDWQFPDKIASSLESVKAAVVRTGTLKGWAGSETMARMKEVTSNVHVRVIDTALQEKDPEYAMGYMNQFKDEMTAGDLLRVRGVITKDVAERSADTIATSVVTAARRLVQPTDYDRMTAITIKSESGGRELGADGKTLTSPAGAKGIMQVLDGTVRDPGYGVKPAADASPEERARVGRDYLAAMVKNYGGDAAKAWGAYNWGPGNMDAAIKEHGADWLAHAPSETQKYVTKNLAALGTGGGVSKPTLQDVHDQVRAQVAAKFGAAPPAGVLKLAIAGATQQFEDLTKAAKATDDQHVTEAMQGLLQVGGRFTDLPYAVRSKIPADKVDSVISFGQKISKGDDITNPAVYQRLSDEKVLKGLSDDQFYHLKGELSASDFQHFATQRGALAGKAVAAGEAINMGALNVALGDRMRTLGLDPTPKDGSDEAVRLGVVKKHLIDTMLAQQKISGKQMTDADVEKHIDGQFAKSVGFRSSFLGIGTGRGDQRLLTMKAGDIPDDTRDALLKDFKAAGVTAPTDGDLLGAYLKLKSLPFKAPKPRDTAQFKTGIIKGMP